MKVLLIIIVLLVAGLSYGDETANVRFQQELEERFAKENPGLQEKYDTLKREFAEFRQTINSSTQTKDDIATCARFRHELALMSKSIHLKKSEIGGEMYSAMKKDKEKAKKDDKREKKIAELKAGIEEYRKAYPPNPVMVAKAEASLANYLGEGPKSADVVEEKDGIVGTWVFIREDIERFKTVNYYADHTCKQGELKGKWEIKTGWVVTTWEDSKGETHGLKLPIVEDNRGCQFNAQGEIVFRFRIVRVSKMVDASQESVQKTVQSVKDEETKWIQAQKLKAKGDKWK